MTRNPAARLSIVAYRPKPGKEAELLALAHEHAPFLRDLGLATDRAAILSTAADGTVLEVFEWSEGGLDIAHSHPRVNELWTRFSAVCDFVPLSQLAECAELFANFVPVN